MDVISALDLVSSSFLDCLRFCMRIYMVLPLNISNGKLW